MTLLDELLPLWDVAARYWTLVRARPATVYRSLWSVDLGALPLTRWLMRLRGIPPGRRVATLRDLTRRGFTMLGERSEEEVVLGTIGRFWRLQGELAPATRDDFAAELPPGVARAAWSFRVTDAGGGKSALTTETRVQCADTGTRRRFRLYWTFVGPASGWIRREMLRAVRLQAEQVGDAAKPQSAV